MIVRILLFIASILGSVWLTACGPIKTHPLTTYTLCTFNPPKLSPKVKTHLTLLVSNPSANPGYQSAAMLYMRSPYQLQAYANNRWVAPPAQMIQPLLIQALRNTRYFEAVVSPPFAGIAQYHLDTQVLKLHQEFLVPASQIRFAVQATLINNKTGKVMGSRLFEALIPAPNNDPYSGVLAANRAAEVISKQIARFCTHLIR